MTETMTLNKVYEEIKEIEKKMVTKEDLNTLFETVSILANAETMRQVAESDRDIQEGRVKEVTSFENLLSEL